MKLKFDAEGMGKKIKHYREQLGMTRDDLANAIDYPHYWIELLEDGDTDLKMSVITDIANVLNVEPSWLLAWKPEDQELVLVRGWLNTEKRLESLNLKCQR